MANYFKLFLIYLIYFYLYSLFIYSPHRAGGCLGGSLILDFSHLSIIPILFFYYFCYFIFIFFYFCIVKI
ncbi:hypothetical protein [Capybara microvirus Cap3_SP_347]|nr:hypothetical protein [Capybara microvirus Cap3_SP_347]